MSVFLGRSATPGVLLLCAALLVVVRLKFHKTSDFPFLLRIHFLPWCALETPLLCSFSVKIPSVYHCASSLHAGAFPPHGLHQWGGACGAKREVGLICTNLCREQIETHQFPVAPNGAFCFNYFTHT
jgi:hypothetical protein